MEGKHEAARAPRKNHRRSGAGMTALKVLGTLLAIGVCTALMFFGIFMKYVHTTLEPVLDVDMSHHAQPELGHLLSGQEHGRVEGAAEDPRHRGPHEH